MGIRKKVTTFTGGIHPFGGKDLSKNLPVKEVLPKSELVFPMSQHIGAPSEPVVAVGDKVLTGQKIARAQGFVSTDICCSVSGRVKAIEPRLTVAGTLCKSIVIENDNEYKTVPGFGEERDYRELSKEQIRTIIKEAGIVGMGGAGFPTHVKLMPKNEEEISCILVNGAECEPYLTSDYRMMLEKPEKLVCGLKVILKLFDNAEGIIAIEDNKPEAIKAISEAVKGERKISVAVLKTKYPQGAERQLIYAVTGRKINSSMLPADVGCIVNNVDTVLTIYRAVCENIPLIRRVVTVTGDAVREPRNFRVRTGTHYSELIEGAGGFAGEPEKIVSGGPMMGLALFNLDVPVTKISSALLCLLKDPVAQAEPSACIRCGRCVEACPSHLVPQRMMEYAERFEDEQFQKIFGMECYECGSCTFVCPAKRRLTQAFKQTRRSILESRRGKG